MLWAATLCPDAALTICAASQAILGGWRHRDRRSNPTTAPAMEGRATADATL
jgi:hypothetical protein